MEFKRVLKENARGLLLFTFANIFAALNFNLLLKPINLVAGGGSGLAIVLNNFFHISTSHLITIIFAITFLFSLFFLPKKTVLGIVYSSILYPVCIYLTEGLAELLAFTYSDILLIAISSGIVSGITNGVGYKYGFASGGLAVIPMIINRYFKVSISAVNFIINALIVIIGGYFYGFNMVLYAIILLYINSYICNMIILGVSNNKVMFVRSKKEDDIIDTLHNKYHLTATILDNKKKNTLVVVINNRLYPFIRKDLLKIDKDIFFLTDDCYEVGK